MGNTGLTTAYMFFYQEHKKHRTKAFHLATANIKSVSDWVLETYILSKYMKIHMPFHYILRC